MASTYSPNLVLELETTGENNGTWGTLTNANWSLVDLTLGGRLSTDASGSSDVTLTAAQYRNVLQKLTGTLTGNINLITPNTGRFLFVWNATSGAFTVTVKPTGGTGIVVPQGVISLVFINPDTTTAIDPITGKSSAYGAAWQAEITVASAATADILSVNSFFVAISGTTTITSLGTTANVFRLVRFTGALTLTYNATSLILPGGANITTAAGDTMILVSDGSGNVRVLDYVKASAAEASVASAATTNIGAAGSPIVNITGTTTITAFDTVAAGIKREGRFSGVLTLTHNATSLILPGAANITTAANDRFVAYSLGSGNWLVSSYIRADGANPQPSFEGATTTLASAATTDLGTINAKNVQVTGTTTITSFGSTAPAGTVKRITFAGALTLTYNATSMILPGTASIVTAANDSLVAVAQGSGNWTVVSYQLANGQPVVASAVNFAPQGRLTLVSATPVMTTTQSAKTTVYWTPYFGLYFPWYNGTTTSMVLTGGELSLALATSGTGYQQSGKNFDFFIENTTGTPRLVTGPAWTSDTVRALGLEFKNGFQVNNASGTFRFGSAVGNTLTISQDQATWVGTMRASADGQCQYIFGAAAAGGTAAAFNLFNYYNQIEVGTQVRDSTASWAYTGVLRAMDNSTAMRVSYIDGSGERAVTAVVAGFNDTAGAGVGVGIDSTTALTGTLSPAQLAAFGNGVSSGYYRANPGLGWHFIQALEVGIASNTFYGGSAAGIGVTLWL